MSNFSQNLTIPVNFIFGDSFAWPEIIENRLEDLSDAELARRATSGGTWISSSYVHFRRAGYNVSWSYGLKPDVVNVIHPNSFGRSDRDSKSFVLCARGDRHDMAIANIVLNQNRSQVTSERHSWIYIWPQSDIKRRNPERGSHIERVTFKGHPRNLDARFQEMWFHDALREMGVEFDMGPPDGEARDWTDYSESDLVLASRNMTLEDAKGKPASKLVNAWLAEVPALLGPEPAFREIRRSELDYVEITTPDTALTAIKALKDDPSRYLAMIENGRERASYFTPRAIVEQWVEVLNGPVRAAFERWQARPAWWKAAWVARAHVLEGRARKAYKRNIHEGPRIFDLPPA